MISVEISIPVIVNSCANSGNFLTIRFAGNREIGRLCPSICYGTAFVRVFGCVPKNSVYLNINMMGKGICFIIDTIYTKLPPLSA